MRFLVLDDDSTIGSTVGRMLQRMGFDATTVTSTGEALGLLESLTFDCVLTDQNLEPGLSGLDFLDVVAARYPDIRRILMSAGTDEHWQGVAHALLDKPFTKEALQAALTMPRPTTQVPPDYPR